MMAGKRLVLQVASVTATIVICFGFGYWWSRQPRPRVVQLGGSLRLNNGDGSVADTNDLSDADSLLVFLMPTECPVCPDTAPAWQEWARRVTEATSGRIQVLVLSHSTEANTKTLLVKNGLRGIPALYLDQDGLRTLNAIAMPSTLILERYENAYYWDGVLSEADVEEISERLLSD